jgi:cysteine desulfurase family protein
MSRLLGGFTQNISEHDVVIYLDNAATTWPKPEIVYRTMDTFLRTKGGNPGRGSHSMALAARETVEETRMLLARLFNIKDANRVIFTLNCTDALNLALKGLLKQGDHVITSRTSHNSLARPLRKLEENGVQITRLAPTLETGFVSSADIEAAVNSKTKLIAITHASNVTGIIQAIEKYGAIARKHHIAFLVDAAQTAGSYPIDVQTDNIDLLAFPGHKSLFGPTGTGGLYISEFVDLDTLKEGGTGSFSEEEVQPDVLPDKYESGTQNGVGLSGLGAGLKFIFSEGLEKIRNHERRLTENLVEGLGGISGVTLYLAPDINNQAPVVSFNIDGYEPGEVGVILDQSFDIKTRTGLHCAPAAHKTIGTFPRGTVRLSPGYFNTIEEIGFTVRAIDRIARSGTLKNPCTGSCPQLV